MLTSSLGSRHLVASTEPEAAQEKQPSPQSAEFLTIASDLVAAYRKHEQAYGAHPLAYIEQVIEVLGSERPVREREYLAEMIADLFPWVEPEALKGLLDVKMTLGPAGLA